MTNLEHHHARWAELDAANVNLSRCPCGSKAILRYVPGVTFIACLAERATKAALPDWQPTELAHDWNNPTR